MAKKEKAAENQEQQPMQVHMAPELEYAYRDFFSIHVGMEEVVIDLGNRHRAQADRATIQNHIVLSIPNAVRLQAGLARSLEEARKRVQEAAAQNNADGEEK
ncbi:MAG: hypothetical protein ACYTGH_07220 [Planctomycetota bacterium]|jgi:hypothetical protein